MDQGNGRRPNETPTRQIGSNPSDTMGYPCEEGDRCLHALPYCGGERGRTTHAFADDPEEEKEDKNRAEAVYGALHRTFPPFPLCLLYTSDAADAEDSVDLGGR